ncbi:kinesin-like protein KIF20B [Hylaeus volcanicus]|uniref:kinesin-like protein KIF20B n=1 Tax=Hylaeus volcanicus TaxID=313075 RepID=UPI0023B83DB1|nr:kinesin-like protein KIF20B [Hylaeus volcanicus]
MGSTHGMSKSSCSEGSNGTKGPPMMAGAGQKPLPLPKKMQHAKRKDPRFRKYAFLESFFPEVCSKLRFLFLCKSDPRNAYLRIKPSTAEVNSETYTVVYSTTLHLKKIDKKFTFARIFDRDTSQADLFDRSVRQRVVDFLLGESSTIVAYGASNSGKTYTLYGTAESPGIFPRSIEFLFSSANCTLVPWYKATDDNQVVALVENEQLQEEQSKLRVLRSSMLGKDEFAQARSSLDNSAPLIPESEEREFYGAESMCSVWLSFAQIYNDNVYDLLVVNDRERCPLKLTTRRDGSTYVKGLKSVHAITGLEACQWLILAQSRMAVATTELNDSSSRSHTFAIVRLLKYQKKNAPNEVQVSTLTFCDVAGAGRFNRVKETSTSLTETTSIKNSLLVLGRCLKSVCGSDQAVAPFRESKLTRILQNALTGRENISFMVTVDVESNFSAETLNALNISNIARRLGGGFRVDLKRGSEVTPRCPKMAFLPPILHTPEKTVTLEEHEALKRQNQRLIEELEALKVATSRHKVDKQSQTDSFNPCEDLQEQNEILTKKLEALERDRVEHELNIRRELMDQCLKATKDLEDSWKKRVQEIEFEGRDLLKWSVDHVEMFYKERISNLMHGKKRRRSDSGDDRSIYEDLESENAQITSKAIALKEMVSSLKSENEALVTERNKCSFELAFVKKKLIDFHNIIRNFPGFFLNVEEKMKRECLNETVDSCGEEARMEEELRETLLAWEETSGRAKELEDELCEKVNLAESLQLQVELLKKEMAELKECHANCEKYKFVDDSARKSSSVYNDFFCSGDVRESDLVTQAHVDTKLEHYFNFDSKKKKISLNDSCTDRCFENIEITEPTIRSHYDSMKEDSGIDSSCRSRRSTSVSDSLMLQESKETSFPLEESLSFKNQSSLREQLEALSLKCRTEHLPKIEELENEASAKTLELNELKDRLAGAQSDLSRVHQLHEKVNELETVLQKRQQERNDYRQLFQKYFETQSMLEIKLQRLSVEIRRRDRELIALEAEIENASSTNSANNENLQAVSKEINESKEAMHDMKIELACSEEVRNHLEEVFQKEIANLQLRLGSFVASTGFLNQICKENKFNKEEVEGLRLQLLEREKEIDLFKRHKDEMMNKYERLVEQLRFEIGKRKDQSTNVSKRHSKFAGTKCGKFKFSHLPMIRGRSAAWLPRTSRKIDDKESDSMVSRCSTGQHRCARSLRSYSQDKTETFDTSSMCNTERSYSTEDSWGLKNFELRQTQSDASDSSEVTCRCGIGFRDARRLRRMSGWMRVRRMVAQTELLCQTRKEHVCINDSETEVT